MTACAGCGFDTDAVAGTDVPDLLTDVGARFRERLLAADPDAVRVRPRPDVWSPLEYACHLRDVLLVQRERLFRVLVENCPTMTLMHRDERALLGRYNREDPRTVADGLAMAAGLAAWAFGAVDGAQWQRRLVYNWPEPRERDVRWLAAHTLHEGRHHLHDWDAVITGRVPGD